MKNFPFILLFIPITLFALPCPNGGGFLYKGNSIEDVLKQCGQPPTQKTYTRIIYSQQEWIYYKPHLYDSGFSQISILFKLDRVAQIRVLDRYWTPICRQSFLQVGQVSTLQTSCGDWIYYPTVTNLCGPIFGLGDNNKYVETICGVPNGQTALQTYTSQITELTYGPGNQQTIIFENGKLLEWR